jgi:hypothetical protein
VRRFRTASRRASPSGESYRRPISLYTNRAFGSALAAVRNACSIYDGPSLFKKIVFLGWVRLIASRGKSHGPPYAPSDNPIKP